MSKTGLSISDEWHTKFIGSWRLTAFTMTDADRIEYPLGRRPGGQISYGADGFMSVHLVREQGLAAQSAMTDYTGYYGAFSVDAARRTVTHHIVGASAAQILASDQVREFQFDADLLTLSATLPRGRAELVWRRATTFQDIEKAE